MSRSPLYQFIGDPIVLFGPSTAASDGSLTASNASITGIPVRGYDGVLFLEIAGATDVNAAHQWQIQYSTSSAGSDAATSNAAWTCTDAVFTAHPRAAAGSVLLLDFNLKGKGITDTQTGHLFITLAAAETGGVVSTIVGIPYGGSREYPATNALTVVYADSQS